MKILNKYLLKATTALSFIIGVTSKVLAQYGAPIMEFRMIGEVKSAVCEQPIANVEVTLANNQTGNIQKFKTSEDGRFGFNVSEYEFENEFVLNFKDKDGIQNQGQFNSRSISFVLNENTKGINNTYYFNQQDILSVILDYKGKNPCLTENTIVEPVLPEIEPANIKQEEEPEIDGPPSNIEPNPEHDYFVIYPNPTDGILSIGVNVLMPGEYSILIYTSDAQLVLHKSEFLETGKNTITLNISEFAKGNYSVLLKSENQIFTKQLIKL